MSNPPIKSSKPVNLEGTRSEVYEYFPQHKRVDKGRVDENRAPIVRNRKIVPLEFDGKKSLLFLNRGKIDLLKTAEQREKVFKRIGTEEHGLKPRTAIEITNITETEYSYTYRQNGQLVRKTIPAAGAEVLPKTLHTTSKTHDLTLRKFKQESLGSALVEGIKAALHFLATPFAAFYRLVSGGEARDFADMLTPIEHDRVGELTHDRVLNQISFLGQFLQAEDSAGKGRQIAKGLSIVPGEIVQVHKARSGRYDDDYFYDCPVKERKVDRNGKVYYSVYIESWTHRYFFDVEVIDMKKTMEGRHYGKGADWFYVLQRNEFKDIDHTHGEYLIRDNGRICKHRNLTQNGVETLQTTDLDCKEVAQERDHAFIYDEDGENGEVRPFRHQSRYNHVLGSYEGWHEVQYGEDDWRKVPADTFLASTHGAIPQERRIAILEDEKKPRVESAVGLAAQLFAEAAHLGKEIHEARNSGSKKQTEGVAVDLVSRIRELDKDHRHLIVPVGQGEGKNYVPHFLLFEYQPEESARPVAGDEAEAVASRKPERLLMKQISFSSTSIDTGRISAIRTFDVTKSSKDPAKMRKFFRALVANHPYTRAKDKKEVSLRGPMNKDFSFESLLTTFGTELSLVTPQIRSSRDPVKALFTLLKELGLHESHLSHLSEIDSKMPELVSSKGKFFKFYVDHLIAYYEENESKLTGDERARSLDGILWYANKVRHYMEKEIGVDGALAITEHLLNFVEAKLEALKRTEELEQKDLKNLESKVTQFWATLSEPIQDTLALVTSTKSVESYRVQLDEMASVELVRSAMTKAQPRDLLSEEAKSARAKALVQMQGLVTRVEYYLQKGELLAAKALLLSMMEALPPARPSLATQDVNVWDLLSREELDQWSQALEKIGASMFEATARSGTFPLRPHEVFEFHVVLPLLQRYLFQLKIPKMEVAFDQAWESYRTNDVVKQRLAQKLDAFIAMREKQIEEEITERLKRRWKQEDDAYDGEWSQYRRDMVGYRFEMAIYQVDPRGRYYPHEPRRPREIDKAAQKRSREQELVDEIQRGKENDDFLNELKGVKRNPIEEMDWDRLTRSSERMIAVMASFAQIVGISKELLSYKINGTRLLLPKTSYGTATREEIWLMRQDCSVLVGSSPFFEKRFQGCERAFKELKWKGDEHGRETATETVALPYIIGYDGLGDGTEFQPTKKGREQKEELESNLLRHHAGFFNSAAEGHEMLIPVEIASCLKVVEMRKILGHPQNYLRKHISGIGGAIGNLFNREELTFTNLQKKFQKMARIHFVAAKESVFTLSLTPDKPGDLATTHREETPPTHYDREKFLGQSNPEMCITSVGRDRERAEFNDSVTKESRLFKGLDAAQEYLMRQTDLSQGDQSTLSRHTRLGYPASYLSISQCFHFIYQYPDKLALPSVQHTLFKTFFQHGLIREHLLNNPEFFIQAGPVLDELCRFLSGKTDLRASEIFIREVCHRIRHHALDLERDLKERYGADSNYPAKISAALPVYDKDTIAGACLSMMGQEGEKEFATLAVSFYCHEQESRGIPADNIEEWTKALNAFYIMQKSPMELGHSGWQAELVTKGLTLLLPTIGKYIQENAERRKKLLKELTGREGNWTPVAGREYTYSCSQGTETFTVDLRTGEGFKVQPKLGEKCKLPEQIRHDKQYKFLFNDANPTVTSIRGTGTIIDYIWKNESAGTEVTFRYDSDPDSRKFQIFQSVRGQKYLFQRISLSTALKSKIWQLFARHNNKTVEELIKNKGVWIPIESTGKRDLTRVLVAQHDQNIEKDPITLHLKGNKIVEASLGKGEDKKIICSGLSERDASLISCRDGNGLLLLSKDGKRVDEIRFPRDGHQEQLILSRSEEESTRWVVSGREDWEWKLTDTKEYEKRFGKNWRHYILPLKNKRTEEQEFWIFPHMIGGGEKKGSDVKFLRSAVDFIDHMGAKLSSTGLVEDLNEESLGQARMLLGAAEQFTGGMGNLFEAGEMVGGQILGQEGMQQHQPILDMLKGLTSPRAIRYRMERRSESSSHAGFFYLAFVACKRQDWGTASRYLEMMAKCGHSSADDIQQLQKMLMTVLIDFEKLLGPKSPLEAAFFAKLVAQLIALNTKMKASHGIDLFKIPEGLPIPVDQLPRGVTPEEGLLFIIRLVGARFFSDHRGSLSQHSQALREHGLLLTKQEESLLSENPLTLGLGLATPPDLMSSLRGLRRNENAEEPKGAAPFQLAIPKDPEISAMVKEMGKVVNPYGVWSIHDLHKKEGAYPKWSTVLANFWSYWGWIYENELDIEDISFLLRELPPGVPHRDAIDTARRLLLIHWHHSHQERGPLVAHRHVKDSTMETLYRGVRDKQLEVTDLAGLLEKSERLKQEALMEPGPFRTGYSFVYDKYVQLRQMLSGLSYVERVGGVPHNRGALPVFLQESLNLLQDYLEVAISPLGREVITIDVIRPPQRYQQVAPVPVVDPHKELRERAVDDLLAELGVARPDDANTQEALHRVLSLPFEPLWSTVIRILEVQEVAELKQRVQQIVRNYQRAVGIPEDANPKTIETIDYDERYEEVEIRPPEASLNWGQRYFRSSCEKWNPQTQTWEGRPSLWEERAQAARKLYDPQKINAERRRMELKELSVREAKKLEKICAGIDEAKEDLIERTKSSFDVTKLKPVHQEIKAHLKGLRKEEKLGRQRILEFARSHATDLGILHLFADRNRFSDQQIFDQVLDLYRYGQLGRLENPKLQIYFAELITETILVTTERQQYEKALETCQDLSKVLKGIIAGLPGRLELETRQNIAQTKANQSVDWILYSCDLKRFLEEGSDRLRYVKKDGEGNPERSEEGRYLLPNQHFTRRYLVSDIRNHWISRTKAIDALEKMMKDLKKGDKDDKPVRFIRAKMGTGKSDFVFPEAIDLFLQHNYRPVMLTTDELVSQLQESMGHRAFVFKFDIHFGLDEKATPQQIEKHLTTLLESLNRLEEEGKAVLTSPSQMGGLRDKRVQLQEMLRMKEEGEERKNLFNQLQLVKLIEAYLKDRKVRYLVDEDVNYDNSFEFNYAIGEYRTVDKVRFEVAERMIYQIKENPKNEHLWNLIVNNNLRSIQNVNQEFRGVAEQFYDDTTFWVSVGWDEARWKTIPKQEFVAFVMGEREALPTNMPAGDPKKDEDKQREVCYVAALKTFLSKTVESVRGVNPKLERGISASNGVTVVPYSDGDEKVGVLYGEESETILHHIFHYLGQGNKIGEDIYIEKDKLLGASDQLISTGRPETWKKWASDIAGVAIRRYGGNKYEAFIKDPELAIQRFQLLRHLMLETPEIRVYLEQITYNSQDLGPGADVRVGSGTGQPYALNLAEYTDGIAHSADAVYGETLLCLDLDKETTTFGSKEDPENPGSQIEETPLDFIKRQAADKECHAILNYDYDVFGNDTERVAAEIRQKGRQAIYRDKDLDKKMWYPGDQFFAMRYEPGAIAGNALFYYGRKDSRGVHFHIPRGGHHYGTAMVGTANKEDPIAQLLWRMRHLDIGHHVRLAHDRKTDAQIRKALYIPDDQKVRQGHAFLYFTLNTLQEEDVKNVKAAIFKAQTPVKTHLDAEVRKPYNMSAIGKHEPALHVLADLEAKVVYPASRGLYILSSRINWLREYEPQKMIDPITFVRSLYEEEKKRLQEMHFGSAQKQLKGFRDFLKEFIKTHKEFVERVGAANVVNWIEQQVALSKALEGYSFESSLKTYIEGLRGSPNDIALMREVILKVFAVRMAFVKTEADIDAEQKKLEEQAYQQFLKENLPEKIAADPVGGARNEQKVQQLQQQKREEKVEQQERVFRPVLNRGATKPMDFARFKQVATGQARIELPADWGSHHYRFYIADHFKENGFFLPLKHVLRYSDLGVHLPDALYKKTYISQRAWELLVAMGQNGVPGVELLVVQMDDGKTATVITTPAEREEKIAPAMIKERKYLRQGGRPAPADAAVQAQPINIDAAKRESRTAIVGLAGPVYAGLGGLERMYIGNQQALANMIAGNYDSNQRTFEPYLRQFLAHPTEAAAWAYLQREIPNILTALGMDGHAGRIMPHVPTLETPFKQIYQRHRVAGAAAIQAPVAVKQMDRISVFALSNEKFSRLVMDAVTVPKESEHFIHLMVLNKLFLNWAQFTLRELDHLCKLIDQMSKSDFDSFVIQLDCAHSSYMAEYLKVIRERRSKPEWILKLVQRKLNDNYIKQLNDAFRRGETGGQRLSPFSQEEKEALEKWIKANPTIVGGHLDIWQRATAKALMDGRSLATRDFTDTIDYVKAIVKKHQEEAAAALAAAMAAAADSDDEDT